MFYRKLTGKLFTKKKGSGNWNISEKKNTQQTNR